MKRTAVLSTTAIVALATMIREPEKPLPTYEELKAKALSDSDRAAIAKAEEKRERKAEKRRMKTSLQKEPNP